MVGSMTICRETWCWEEAENSTSGSTGGRTTETGLSIWDLKTHPSVTHFLQQWKSHYKVTSPNSATFSFKLQQDLSSISEIHIVEEGNQLQVVLWPPKVHRRRICVGTNTQPYLLSATIYTYAHAHLILKRIRKYLVAEIMAPVSTQMLACGPYTNIVYLQFY